MRRLKRLSPPSSKPSSMFGTWLLLSAAQSLLLRIIGMSGSYATSQGLLQFREQVSFCNISKVKPCKALLCTIDSTSCASHLQQKLYAALHMLKHLCRKCSMQQCYRVPTGNASACRQGSNLLQTMSNSFSCTVQHDSTQLKRNFLQVMTMHMSVKKWLALNAIRSMQPV